MRFSVRPNVQDAFFRYVTQRYIVLTVTEINQTGLRRESWTKISQPLVRRRPWGLRAGAVRGQGLRDPDGWQVVPVRRKVGALRKRFDLDPTNLSLLGGQAGVPV